MSNQVECLLLKQSLAKLFTSEAIKSEVCIQGEAFPTYPRTYDLVHADGLLSLETSQQRRCTMLDMFILSI
ncbi:hypothetical protein AHAS_Ahas13G0247800 [Arachis hypogaea]